MLPRRMLRKFAEIRVSIGVKRVHAACRPHTTMKCVKLLLTQFRMNHFLHKAKTPSSGEFKLALETSQNDLPSYKAPSAKTWVSKPFHTPQQRPAGDIGVAARLRRGLEAKINMQKFAATSPYSCTLLYYRTKMPPVSLLSSVLL